MTAPPLANLINELTKLPGVGGKSAQRLAYYLLKRTNAEAEALAAAILEVKSKIFRCSLCNNMTDVEPCAICSDPRRDPAVICVVEEAFNIPTIEATRDFKGLYHVLLGALSPLKGVGPPNGQEVWYVEGDGSSRHRLISLSDVRRPDSAAIADLRLGPWSPSGGRAGDRGTTCGSSRRPRERRARRRRPSAGTS